MTITGGASPHILLLTNYFAPQIGGAGAVAEALAANLPAHITVVAPRTRLGTQTVADWAAHDRRFGFRCVRVPAFEWKPAFALPPRLRGPARYAANLAWTRPLALISLLRQVAIARVDIVCVNSLLSCYWVAPLLKLLRPRLKVVFYLHGEEVDDGPHPPRIDRLAQRRMRAADAVVCVSAFTRERALRCGVDPGKLTVIHNGVDIARFTPGPPDPTLQARFNLEGRNVLLCLARLDERKGQDRLIDAMPEILISVPDAVLLLVGSGSPGEEERLRARAAAQGLEGVVLFAGPATDAEVAAFYRTADVYVMPNRTTAGGDTEGFGLVFLEAGACGKPVIGGNAGGVPEAIIDNQAGGGQTADNQTGFLVDGRSPAAIAQACVSLLRDPALAARLGANGLAHSRDNSWERQSQRFLALCRSVCAAP